MTGINTNAAGGTRINLISVNARLIASSDTEFLANIRIVPSEYMYLVNGKRMKNVPRDSEYNHQKGYASSFAGRNDASTEPSDPVRKLPVP